LSSEIIFSLAAIKIFLRIIFKYFSIPFTTPSVRSENIFSELKIIFERALKIIFGKIFLEKVFDQFGTAPQACISAERHFRKNKKVRKTPEIKGGLLYNQIKKKIL